MISLVKVRSESQQDIPDQKLLIVDDEPLMRSGLRHHLEQEGRTVFDCGTGAEAIALIKSNDMELVLLDINLPDISGLDILEWIRANRKATSVILVSGDDSIDSAIKALRHGAAEFVRKPYDIDDIRHKVNTVLHNRKLERNSVLMAARLEQSERLHRFMVESSPDIIYTLDRTGCFTFVNGRIESLLGWTREELIGSPYFTIVHDDDRDQAIYAFNEKRTDHRATTNLEIRLKCKKGSEHRTFEDRQVVTMLSAVGMYETKTGSNDAVEQTKRYLGTYGVARDITERKLAEETISFQALHDHLTHLPNRRLFRDRLELAIIQSKRSGVGLAVMFIDMDRFKLVNDTHGHAEGDELIRNVAQRLRGCIRAGDTLARQGGDEFTALITDLRDEGDATIIAEKIIDDFKIPYKVVGNEFRTTASVGIAIYPRDGETAEALIRNADISMYKAKGKGKNCFQIYSPAISACYQDRLELENELRQALQNDEFELYFQPQINVESRRIIGVEALLRWRHPVRGLLNPSGFIELAEETGLIASITDWVLIEACTHMAGWRAMGFYNLRLAVNFSPSEFERNDVVERIFAQLDHYGIPGDNLEVEITENLLLSETVGVVEKMRQLRSKGVRIAIDDFGTRYSSLNYLRSFPISAIKIDQSFVRDLSERQGTSPIISAIVGIAQGFGLQLIAEGIETVEQMNLLRELGCEEMQGYLFSRPVPGSEIKGLLTGMSWCPAELSQAKFPSHKFVQTIKLEKTG
jgi:diguanylate cyclase (GGDEF)-like protein/PAS domain S-box-containing protein